MKLGAGTPATEALRVSVHEPQLLQVPSPPEMKRGRRKAVGQGGKQAKTQARESARQWAGRLRLVWNERSGCPQDKELDGCLPAFQAASASSSASPWHHAHV